MSAPGWPGRAVLQRCMFSWSIWGTHEQTPLSAARRWFPCWHGGPGLRLVTSELCMTRRQPPLLARKRGPDISPHGRGRLVSVHPCGDGRGGMHPHRCFMHPYASTPVFSPRPAPRQVVAAGGTLAEVAAVGLHEDAKPPEAVDALVRVVARLREQTQARCPGRAADARACTWLNGGVLGAAAPRLGESFRRCRSAPGRAPGAAAGRRGGSTLSPGWHAQSDTAFRETATVCVDDAHGPASPCMRVGPARQQTVACALPGASAACRARGRCTRSHQPPERRAAPRRCRWCSRWTTTRRCTRPAATIYPTPYT